MKIFLIHNGVCYWNATEQFPTLESTVGRFPADMLFVETPDEVCEGWKYDAEQDGDARFIESPTKTEAYKALTVAKIRAVYSENSEYRILREYLAYPDDEEKRQGFADYNAFVEQCKDEAYAEIFGEEDGNSENDQI